MESKIEIIQINISGEDKPGMTSSLTDILARYDAFILDIGQANIHQSLTLGILFMTTSDKSGAILKELLCQVENINIAQSIAVGDGANDLPMLDLAGLGIAFHAKPKVKATASQSISTIGLDGVLYFLGLKDSWIE